MSEVITDVKQATPDRLTVILQNNDYLKQGEVITVQSESPYNYGVTSALYRLTLNYSDNATKSAPSQLLLKIRKSEVPEKYGKKEVEFYKTIVSKIDNPLTVHCYDAKYCNKSGNFHLLLDDMSATHFQPEWPLPPSTRHCEKVIDCIAKFHAYWWNHSQLGVDIGCFPQEESFRGSLHDSQNIWKEFVDFMGDRLTLERRELFDRVIASWPGIWETQRNERLISKYGITIVHDDPHMWNVLHPHDPDNDSSYLIDWQTWRVGFGTDDLAYMIALQWYPDRRKYLEHNLIKQYHNVLMKHGVKNYEWEDCWSDYRMSVIYNLFTPIRFWYYKHVPALWMPHLERSVLAFEDLGCAELLEH